MACNSYTHTLIITIGRKVGTKEMDAQTWDSFKYGIIAAILDNQGEVIQHPKMGKMRAHDQVGVWEGQTEPAATFVGFISGYQNIAYLRQRLAHMAGKYKQEAIGCVVTLGTDHLVFPSV